MKKTECDYSAIDPAVVKLCRAINDNFPGLSTRSSCQGFIDDHRSGEPWMVSFELDRRCREVMRALESLELLTWMINRDFARGDEGAGIRLGLNSAPPMLNPQPLYFFIQGWVGAAHPDRVAEARARRADAPRYRAPRASAARACRTSSQSAARTPRLPPAFLT